MPAFETSVPLAEAKNKLSEYVDRAAQGEIIVITKHGGALAKLVPVNGPTRVDVAEAVEKIKALRGTNPTTTIDEIIAWKNTGRP